MAAVVLAKAAGGSFGRQSWSQLPKVTGCVVVQQRDSSNNVPTKFKLSALKRGTGGRSSFSGIVATVFGGTGFTGGYIINRLGKIGSQVIIPYRCEPYTIERLRMAGDLGQVLFHPFHLNDEDSIRRSVQYSNVVINLIGQDTDTKNFTLNQANVEGARRIARIAKECGVEKFIHMSHLNAKAEPQTIWKTSQYLKSKYEGELAVREEFPDAIIFKAADIFGDEDRFIRHLSSWYRWTVLPCPTQGISIWEKGEKTIKQPVYVMDVSEGISAAVRTPGLEGKTIECVGGQRYYMKDIVNHLIACMNRECDGLFNLGQLKVRGSCSMIRLRYAIWGRLIKRFNVDRIEREALTDWTTPGTLNLEDLGVNLHRFDDLAFFFLHPDRRNAYDPHEMGTWIRPDPPLTAEQCMEKEKRIVPGV